MAYRVKYKMASHMYPDKDDWGSVAEWKAAHETADNDFKSDITSGQAKYKVGTSSLAVESGEVFMTVTYNSEADYTSATNDYQTARAAAGIERRTHQTVVSAAEV